MNRAYYAVFYFILALFQNDGINARTSKHSGVIGTFDKEYVISGKADRKMGKIVHSLFDARQEWDYKEMAEVTDADAREAVSNAREFAESAHRLLLSVD